MSAFEKSERKNFFLFSANELHWLNYVFERKMFLFKTIIVNEHVSPAFNVMLVLWGPIFAAVHFFSYLQPVVLNLVDTCETN